MTLIELDLDRIAHGGAAVGRHAGRVVFVRYALPGERVRARIVAQQERFAQAVAVEVLRPSPARVAPRCDHWGPEGGGPCQWQHIAYDQQLIFKREIVADQLQRVGKLHNPTVHPVIASAQVWGYRHHLTFAAIPDPEPGPNLGFWRDDHSGIVPVAACHLLHPALQEIYDQLDLGSPEIAPHDLVRVRFQMGSDPGDRMIILETTSDLAPEIEVDLPISVNLLLSDHEPVNLIGSPQVTYRVLQRSFRVTAGAYFSPNPPMIPRLVEEVLIRLRLRGDESILEVYSGVGTLTAFLAEQASMVLSVESYPPAVTDAEENTANLDNVELVEGAAEAVLDDLVGPFEAAVLDPPPAGLSAEVGEALARLAIPQIVCVSADPAALARDAQRLTRHGYRLADVQPVDMEPQTPLITCVATLRLG